MTCQCLALVAPNEKLMKKLKVSMTRDGVMLIVMVINYKLTFLSNCNGNGYFHS